MTRTARSLDSGAVKVSTRRAGTDFYMCPDCSQRFPSQDEFIAHREDLHPPTQITISGLGSIQSQVAFGTDSKE